MNEIWKPLINYNENYYISNFGNVKKIINGKESVIKGFINENYKRISIIKKHFYVHKLVAEFFLPNKKNFKMVVHKDHNKLNNNVNNLKWLDPLNINKSKIIKKQFTFYNPLYGKFFLSPYEFLNKFSLFQGNVSLFINGHLKTLNNWIIIPDDLTEDLNIYYYKLTRIRHFYHQIYGNRFNTINQLISEFNDLNANCISRILTGKRTNYKGWIFIPWDTNPYEQPNLD